MADELKPCPFCGGDAAGIVDGGDGAQVLCDACGATGPGDQLDAVAEALWNRRALRDEKGLRAAIMRLKWRGEWYRGRQERHSIPGRTADAIMAAIKEVL